LEDFFIDVRGLPDGIHGFCQLLTVGCVYSYILYYASNLISDGSELLLLVPSLAGLVGSVVLPILGAVPDGCIVLFSGLGPNAQEELSVGVGALAGSTIMLLTVPWFLSILGGRVDIAADGSCAYKAKPKLTEHSLFEHDNWLLSGVSISPKIRKVSNYMLITACSYLIIQVPGLFYVMSSPAAQAKGEAMWATVGMIVCLGFFGYYLYQQYLCKDDKNEKHNATREDLLVKAICNGDVTLLGVMVEEIKRISIINRTNIINREYQSLSAATSPIAPVVASYNTLLSEECKAILRKVVKPFFKRYDKDSNGTLDSLELVAVFYDMGEYLTKEQLNKVFKGKNDIDLDDFVTGVFEYISTHEDLIKRGESASPKKLYQEESGGISASSEANSTFRTIEDKVEKSDDEDDDEDEDEPEMPDELRELSPQDQMSRVMNMSLYKMALGTFLILLFSDPMVSVLSEVGRRTGISSFYISFVFAPLASNASEVIASYNYALKKTSHSMEIALSTLEGAAIMNNTFCLSIFMFLIYSQGLSWEYFSETSSIIFVQVVMWCMAHKKKHTFKDALVILALYPLSLLIVACCTWMGLD